MCIQTMVFFSASSTSPISFLTFIPWKAFGRARINFDLSRRNSLNVFYIYKKALQNIQSLTHGTVTLALRLGEEVVGVASSSCVVEWLAVQGDWVEKPPKTDCDLINTVSNLEEEKISIENRWLSLWKPKAPLIMWCGEVLLTLYITLFSGKNARNEKNHNVSRTDWISIWGTHHQHIEI